MCDFSRVSAWFCDEKISLKKSCFYLYIRRNDVCSGTKAAAGAGYVYSSKTELIKLLKYSLPFIPNQLSWWVIGVSDRTIISWFLNVAENGIYSRL